MDLDINNLNEDQRSKINSYKRINSRLETLQRQMTIIQHEAKCLMEELEDLRNSEKNTNKDGKK